MILSVPTVISNGAFWPGSISDGFVNEKSVPITLLLVSYKGPRELVQS